MADLHVELLSIEGCPHLEQARRDLEVVLRKGIIEVPIQMIFVGSLDDAEFLQFQGSPTIRINGQDVDPRPELPIALACRVYRDAAGKTTGSPPLEMIRAAVDIQRRDKLAEFQRGEAGLVAKFARAVEAAEASSGAPEESGKAEESDPQEAHTKRG